MCRPLGCAPEGNWHWKHSCYWSPNTPTLRQCLNQTLYPEIKFFISGRIVVSKMGLCIQKLNIVKLIPCFCCSDFRDHSFIWITEIFHWLGHSPDTQQLGLGQTKVRNNELQLGLLHGWQGSKYPRHYTLAESWVESGAAGMQNQYLHVGYRHPKHSLACWATWSPLAKCVIMLM